MGFKLQISLKPIVINLLLFVLVFLIKSVAILFPIFLLTIIFLYYKKRHTQFLTAGFYALCMGSEMLYFSYSLVLLIVVIFGKRKYIISNDFDSFRKVFKLFLGYILITYIIQLIANGSVLALPFFAVTFLSPIMVMFYIERILLQKGDLYDLMNSFLVIAIVQVIVAILFQGLPLGIQSILDRPTLGDQVMGTTNSAPSLTMFISMALLPFVLYYFKSKKEVGVSFLLLLLVSAFLFTIILNDSKTQLYAIILSMCLVGFIRNFITYKNKFQTIVLTLSAVIGLLIASPTIVNKIDSTYIKYDEYINGKYNSKMAYYIYAFDPGTRPLLEYLVGTGVGTNGSRASNALAYDVLYKKKNTLTLPSFIPPISSDFTKKYLSTLFEADYANESNYRSAILGNPFNSFCAMFIEFGVFGLILFGAVIITIVIRLFKNKNIISDVALFLLVSNLITSMLDQTFENAMAMHLMWLLIGVSFYFTKLLVAEKSTDSNNIESEQLVLAEKLNNYNP